MNAEKTDFLAQIQDVFLSETREHLEQMEELFLAFERDPTPGPVLEQIFREIHTIKGSANSVGFEELGHLAHVVEDLLVKIRRNEVAIDKNVIDTLLEANDKLANYVKKLMGNKTEHLDASVLESRINIIFGLEKSKVQGNDLFAAAPGEIIFSDDISEQTQVVRPSPGARQPEREASEHGCDEYIRLPLKKIDSILNYFGEQVILQSALEQQEIVKQDQTTRSLVSQLGKVTYELQQLAMSLRMISMKMFFSKMERCVRDTANTLKKKVDFERRGENTELDKNIIDELSSIVPHLVRNSIDHGIETSEERVAQGKSPNGIISMQAYHEGGFFFLIIRDDGSGVNKTKVVEKGLRSGLLKSENVSDEEAFNLIFMSGFSTREVANDVSGRGIGMDAVKSAVERMRGFVSLTSEQGHGTSITIKLPLSMAIFNGMIFSVGDYRFVLPSSRIIDIHRFEDSAIRNLDGVEKVLAKGNEKLPFITLADALGIKGSSQGKKDIASSPSSSSSPSAALAKTEQSRKRRIALIIDNNNTNIAIGVDKIIGQSRIVQKKLGQEFSEMHGVSGGAILGDGGVALILNLDELINA